MDTTTQFIFLILLGGFVSGSESVVYHVLPTKPIDSCPGNGSSSCPLDQHCLKMDYLVEHSSKLFSSDHVTVTLVFMCGVHNYYTKDWTVQNLTSFIVKGAAKSRENVIIDHQFGTQPKSGFHPVGEVGGKLPPPNTQLPPQKEREKEEKRKRRERERGAWWGKGSVYNIIFASHCK